MAETESFYNPNTRRYETRKVGQAISQTGRQRLGMLEGGKTQEEVEAAGGLGAAARKKKKQRDLADLADTVHTKMNEDRVLKVGNPYEIARVKGMHIVRKKGGGPAKGKHKSYKMALRQFNLLEGIHHGWKPTGAPARK
jgi:hypothetical protein